MNAQIKLLIVEDRDVVRDSLKLLIEGQEDIVKVAGEAANGSEALGLIASNEYDVILMDINMPEMNGMEAIKNILIMNPDAKILVNSFLENPAYINSILREGVLGYIIKGNAGKEAYMDAIKKVARGEKYLSDELSNKLLAHNKSLEELKSKV